MIATAPAPARKPRRRAAPSQRDQQLYVEYQTSGVTQLELAEKYQLTQCRISQIVRRVAAWRGGIDPAGRPLPPGDLTQQEQRRLDRWLERQRNEAIFKAALRKIDLPQITTTTKTDADGQVKERAVREQPPNVQYLKVAQRANEQLFRREQLQPVPLVDADAKERCRLVVSELVKMREAAQAAGRVKADSNPLMLVGSLLRAVQGEPPTYSDTDPGLEELGDWMYCQRNDEAEIRRQEEQERQAGCGQHSRPQPGSDETFPAIGPAEANSSTSADLEASPQLDEPAADAAVAGRDETVISRRVDPASPPAQTHPANSVDDAAERRRLHMQKLEQLKIARRRGLPIMLEFDPADGPLPPVYYHIDGVDYP
jgi:hypothetical protein